jgi:DNA-binding transcriptional LysR family regulator
VRGQLRLRPRLVSSSTDLLLQAALGSAGLAILPTLLCGPALRDGRLERLLPDHDFGSMRLLLLYPHRRHASAKLRAFADFLIECFGPDPEADPFVEGLVPPQEPA